MLEKSPAFLAGHRILCPGGGPNPRQLRKTGNHVILLPNKKGVRALVKQNILRLIPALLALLTVAALLAGALSDPRPYLDDEELISLPPPVANPYAPEDFVYNDLGLLTTADGTGVLGVDVSEFQENIDWNLVKASGIEFVMIRVGFRGYGDSGTMKRDSAAADHYAGAKAAGLKVGAYFFSQAITPREAVEEAEFLLRVTGGWELDLPLVFDWEYIGDYARTADMDPRTLTDCSRAFCRVIRRAGHTPMVYFNLTQARDLLYLEELTDFQWWLARYADTMDFDYRVQMWQYTSRGNVPGIPGEVDVNIRFPEG